MQNINNFYKFASEDETMTNFQRKYGIHNTLAPTHNRRHRKYARLANFSLPVGGIIDEPIELEPTYTTLMTRDYCGNYIYCNGTLERILTDNGYIQGDEYYFYIKDYQGNIRVVLNQSNQPVELNSYYPYGALMAATTTEGTQPYKYSAKELDRENGLDLYDSQARHYDPIIPRTTTMDPLAEKYYSLSPYTWCAANPLKYIDDDGKWLRGVKGKRVCFNEKTNKWTNATSDIMMMGNEMAKTKVGLQVLKKMLNVKYPITIVFDRVKVKREDNGVLLGLTTPSLILDKYGKKQFKSVKIVLYLKAIADAPHRDEKHIGLSDLEILGAVAVHEGEHGTNKAASSSFYPEGRNSKAEDLAKIKENQHLEQLKQQKNNRQQEE